MQLRATRKKLTVAHQLPSGKDSFVIGRKTGDFVPEINLSPDPTVSRQHARIGLDKGRYWIEDLGSRLGTHVNGARLEGGKRHPLGPSDLLRIGNTELRLEQDDPLHQEADEQDAQEIMASEELLCEVTASWPREVGEKLLQTIQDGTVALVQGENGTDVARALMRRLLELVRSSDRVALLLLSEDGSDFLLAAHEPEGDPRVSTTLVRLAVEKEQAVIWVRARHGLPKKLAASISEQHLENVMCVPLIWKGKCLGALWLGGPAANGFARADLGMVLAVAHHAAMAVAAERTQAELRNTLSMLKRVMAHFSPQVAKYMLEQAGKGRLRPGGVESKVTLLCSDLRGFTKTTAGMSADEVVEMLNEYFAELVAVILQFGGTIDKFIGDAILAVFGSPAPDPEQHTNAVLAAREMQAAMHRLNHGRIARKLPAMELGIGIHCGKVLHGFIGSEERVEFTVIGQAVNMTSRYCDGAGPGEIIISPELHQVVWKQVKCRRTDVRTKHEGMLPAFLLL